VGQFAVYRNPGHSEEIPFVVQIQSARLNSGNTRVVMALVRRGTRSPPDHPLTPHLTVQGQPVYADPLNVTTLRTALLKNALEVLPDAAQDRVFQAIDEMISRA
jgi:toxin CcdB